MKTRFLFPLTALFLASCLRDEPPSQVYIPKRLNPYHVVKPGETAYDIAQKYKMTLEDFVSINMLKTPDRLIPGQRLLVHPKADDGPNVPVRTGDVVVQTLPEEPDAVVSDIASNDVEKALVPAEEDARDFIWPVHGKVILKFGKSTSDGSTNEGINIQTAEGTLVKASRSGTVRDTGNLIPDYGNMVIVDHPDGTVAIYTYLKQISVKIADLVKVGDKIGTVGKPKRSRIPQLHFEMRSKDLNPLDPEKLLKS